MINPEWEELLRIGLHDAEKKKIELLGKSGNLVGKSVHSSLEGK